MQATFSSLGTLLLAGLLTSSAAAQYRVCSPVYHRPLGVAPDMLGPGYYWSNEWGMVYGPSYNVYPNFGPVTGIRPGEFWPEPKDYLKGSKQSKVKGKPKPKEPLQQQGPMPPGAMQQGPMPPGAMQAGPMPPGPQQQGPVQFGKGPLPPEAYPWELWGLMMRMQQGGAYGPNYPQMGPAHPGAIHPLVPSVPSPYDALPPIAPGAEGANIPPYRNMVPHSTAMPQPQASAGFPPYRSAVAGLVAYNNDAARAQAPLVPALPPSLSVGQPGPQAPLILPPRREQAPLAPAAPSAPPALTVQPQYPAMPQWYPQYPALPQWYPQYPAMPYRYPQYPAMPSGEQRFPIFYAPQSQMPYMPQPPMTPNPYTMTMPQMPQTPYMPQPPGTGYLRMPTPPDASYLRMPQMPTAPGWGDMPTPPTPPTYTAHGQAQDSSNNARFPGHQFLRGPRDFFMYREVMEDEVNRTRQAEIAR